MRTASSRHSSMDDSENLSDPPIWFFRDTSPVFAPHWTLPECVNSTLFPRDRIQPIFYYDNVLRDHDVGRLLDLPESHSSSKASVKRYKFNPTSATSHLLLVRTWTWRPWLPLPSRYFELSLSITTTIDKPQPLVPNSQGRRLRHREYTLLA